MAQLNMNVTPDFESSLDQLMRLRAIASKSEAIRIAVQEAAERARRVGQTSDFRSWRGVALGAALNPTPKFSSEDDLWG